MAVSYLESMMPSARASCRPRRWSTSCFYVWPPSSSSPRRRALVENAWFAGRNVCSGKRRYGRVPITIAKGPPRFGPLGDGARPAWGCCIVETRETGRSEDLQR
ncbi:hypothetical protein BC628DRAFT_175123 [Trametes gibbosa]|nr:hypothetical protein BC628DRAFT_175123 [Trametes gibbosa]